MSSEQNYRKAKTKPSGLTLDYEPNYNEIKKKTKQTSNINFFPKKKRKQHSHNMLRQVAS